MTVAACQRPAALIEAKIVRALAPDPESPSRKSTGAWCGRETEKISTALRKPPWPVIVEAQICRPRRGWQLA